MDFRTVLFYTAQAVCSVESTAGRRGARLACSAGLQAHALV